MSQVFWDWKTQAELQPSDSLFDCQIAEFLLSQGKFVPSLEAALSRYEVTSVEQLAQKQIEKFAEFPKLYEYFTTIEMPIIPIVWKMKQAGISLDVTRLQEVGVEIDAAIEALSETMKSEVGFEINLNSPTQIGNFLAEKLNVPLKKTKTGKYATNETEISQHAQEFPFIQKLLQYRELAKLRSTYVETLISKVEADGRIHTTYSQVAANTGRLSSLNPNLQNIPGSSGFAQKIKSCFVAGKDKVFVSFDYSQQELRILAHLSNEEALISAFRENKDVHTTTASQLFHVAYEDVTSEQRMIAKTTNFGVVYGMSSFGMSTQLHISIEESQGFINAFYKTYPNIRTYFDEYLKDGKTNDFVETMLGRRRYVFEYSGQKFIDNATKRVLINYPIQGSAADLMKKAMIVLNESDLGSKENYTLLLQIHDDLVFEVKNDEKFLKEFIPKVTDIMRTVYPLAVPMEVGVKVGTTWGEMEVPKVL